MKIFQKILLPLCGVNDFVILGISTPQDETNYYSRLLDLKDDEGKPFFVGLRIEQACAACIQNNKADSCDHRLYLLPPWKGGQRHRRMAAIYENDKTTFAQENQGVIINASKTYIFRDFHKAFVGNPPYLFDKRPSVIWVAIDPSGGGCQSQYAMVALVVEGHHHVVRFFFFLFLFLSRTKQPINLHAHQMIVVHTATLALQKITQRLTQLIQRMPLMK